MAGEAKKALRLLRPAIGWGLCLALLIFLSLSFSQIWLLPPTPRAWPMHRDVGTFWECLEAIRHFPPGVGLDDLL
jgi:hypothetical protein